MFCFTALAIILLLPALCEGAHCAKGKLEKDEIDDYVLNPVNKYRQALVTGKQKNGDTGKNMPKPKDMTKLAWNCDLEKAAIDTMKGRCTFETDLSDKDGRATVFYQSYAFGDPLDTEIIKTVFENGLNGINQITLEGVTSKKVVYKSDTPDGLRTYINVIRPKATEIGCAWTKCKEEADPFAIYCVLNAK
ncbi:SCP-like protein [Ancylostoma duodenale]|uniref:SCP-like protein n=1 Tax=Ancylostoma duodenale TaxID=51022 RepID=A0A0C2D1T0_9BILA|nr:SCP-like protein [Ancylostoma duodenale]